MLMHIGMIVAMIGILFLPLSYNDFILSHLRKLFSKIKNYFPESKLKNAELLLEYLSQNQNQTYMEDNEEKRSIPKYKYFSDLIINLYHSRRIFGAEVEELIFELKGAIIKDLQFEKKLSSEVNNAYTQILAITTLTWGFIYLTGHITGNYPTNSISVIIIILQILGLLFFNIFYKKIKDITLKDIQKYPAPVYGLKSLLGTGVAVSVICEKVQVDKLWEMKEKGLKLLSKRLFSAIESLKNSGLPIEAEINSILDEVLFVREQKFIKYLKFVAFLKFAILALFYLTSYFIFILSLFSRLMTSI